MKKLEKSHKGISLPLKRGTKLISLDYYTEEYNNGDEISCSQFNHLLLRYKLSHKGANFVATPQKNIPKLFKHTKRKSKAFLSLFLALPLLFSACSFKTQTNKLPDETKYILPRNSNTNQELRIGEENKQSFEQTLKTFFGFKNNEAENGEQSNIYKVGLERGHFREKEE